MEIFAFALDALLPHRCLLCMSKSQARLCTDCESALPWLDQACRRCALPLDDPSDYCGRCISKPPSFDASLAAFCYAPPIDKLISQFKNQGQLSAGLLLHSFLKERIQQHWSDADPPDVITAVPLHWRRQLQRGFNQSAFLAESLSHQLKIPFMKVARRRLPTPKQQALKRHQRLRNLRHAFVAKPDLVAGRHIAVVDDVLTTGATAEALSRCLKQAGARRVDMWALARTPRPGS